MNKNLGVGALVGVVVVALLLSVAGFYRPISLTLPANFGSVAGTFHPEDEQFMGSVYVSRFADNNDALPGLTTSTTGTVTAKIVCENSVVDIATPGSGNTITLPSSTDMFNVAGSGCLTKVGQHRDLFLNFNTSTGSFTVAISDATSSLRTANVTSTLNTTSSVNAGDVARLTALRHASGTSAWLTWILEVVR